MGEHTPVPLHIVQRLSAICADLPQVEEEDAWVGVRWVVRKRNFAHVLTIDSGRPASYADAARTDGPAVVLTFRSSGEELASLAGQGLPFFKPRWSATVVGVVIDDDTDWKEVEELLIESYCMLAPSKLRKRVAEAP